MPELPTHPEATDAPTEPSRSWPTYVIGGAIAVLVVVVIVLHLTGTIGAGAHG